MKRALIIAGLLWVGLVAYAADQPQLKVFIAAKDSAKGLHEADFPKLPKVGYISDKPDLTISELDGVAWGLKSGNPNPYGGPSQPIDDKAALQLRLTTKDADALQKLVADHLGARLLLMLNDQPLVAPEIRTTMSGQSLYITKMGKEINTDELKANLEKMIPESKKPSPTPPES